MCKAGLISFVNPEYLTKLAEGYFWSIAIMMGIPFVLVGVIVGLVVKANRKKRTF